MISPQRRRDRRGRFFSDPIPPKAGLDQRLHSYWNRIADALRRSDTGYDLCLERAEGFLFGGYLPAK
jgi:hypothetical protein